MLSFDCLLVVIGNYLVVFMGSSKYPDENGFDAFVSKHGGYTNASTDCERVCVIQILQYSL